MKLRRLTDEIILHIIMPDIRKYLALCSEERIKEEYTPKSLDEFKRFDKYDDIVRKFAAIFQGTFTNEQTKAMFYRLNDLVIKEVTYESYQPSLRLSLGYYRSLINEIVIEYYKDMRISKESLEETLIHELLHMASTRRTTEGVVTGFEIPDYLGLELNEGYTDYLTEKYFTKGMGYVKSNNKKLFFAKGIENIIGKDKMEEFYFNADLNGLINELSKYSKKEDIIKLLFAIDRMGKGMRGESDHYKIIYEIAKMNAEKLRQDLDSGRISYERYQIEYVIKVDQYLKGNMWSEETEIIKDGNCFMLKDQGFTSGVYELRGTDKDKNKQKYYQ